MTEKMKELYQGYLDADKDSVAAIGRKSFEFICKRFIEVTGDEKLAFKFALAVFACFSAEDGHLDNYEWAMLEFIMQKDMEKEFVFNLIKQSYDGNTYDEIKSIIDHDDVMKQHVIVLGLCICAIDGNIDEKENELMSYFLGN